MQKLISILESYYNFKSPPKNGLLLLDLPTGFGKTYQTLRFIYDNYQLNPNKKVIFLTNLKKNLPHDTTLKNFFEGDNKLSDYERDVVFIDSNVDCVLKHLVPLEENNEIPYDVVTSGEYEDLRDRIKHYKYILNKKKNKFEVDFLAQIKQEIQETYEPKFRRYITNLIYDNASNKEERIALLKGQFKWVAKIYPAAMSFEKQIFFMSVNKFLVKNTPIVEPSYYFLSDDFLDNALIFIDEFDASKDVILTNIIQQQLEKRIDIIGLFEQIYSSFTSLTIPEVYYRNHQDIKIKKLNKQIAEIEKEKQTVTTQQKIKTIKERIEKLEEKKKIYNVKEIIDKLKQRANEINAEYNITYSVKTIGLRNQKSFLFHDYQYHTIVGNRRNYIYLEQEHKERFNNIHFVDKNEARQDRPTVTEFLNAIRGFIKYFKGGLKIIGFNYQQLKNGERKSTEDQFSIENAFKSFLEELKIKPDHQRYLIDSIQMRKFASPKRDDEEQTSIKSINQDEKKNDLEETESKIDNDFSFYNNGFRYYDFEDNEAHDTKSYVYITDFDTTPEKILLELANHNFVVGISATAKIDTVFGNYNLQYLEEKLDTDFLQLTDVEKEDLKAIFDDRNKNYVPVIPEFISVSTVNQAFDDLGFERAVKNEFTTKIEANDDFIQERYLKIALIFQEFINNDNIQSFLCFLNTHPSKGKQSLDLTILEDFFQVLIDRYQDNSNGSLAVQNLHTTDIYYVLDSKNFEQKKEKVLAKLKTGQKLFLITTYQTLGAGQNIQYELDDFDARLSNGLIKQVFERKGKKEKDFDAIYLDKPSNLVVNIRGDLTEFDVNKRIFELESLFESGKIFYKHLIYEIKRSFKNAYYKDSHYNPFFPIEHYESIYGLSDYHNYVAKEVIQALGRINRTGYKNKEIYVFADKAIASSIYSYDVYSNASLKEFEALVEHAKNQVTNEMTKPRLAEILTERTNINCHNWIVSKVKGKYWSKENIDAWQKLREIVLKYPTISEEQFKHNPELEDWRFIYLKMWDGNFQAPQKRNSYSFTQNNEYAEVEINFAGKGKSQVSETEVHLPTLMKVSIIQDFFLEQGYAQSFEDNDYIIAPIVFNNIYKGALGEEIGKKIFDEYVCPQTQLQELPSDIFERFDYMVDNGIFIDFKFWQGQQYVERDAQVSKIFDIKVPDIIQKGYTFKKVLVVNILANKNYPIVPDNGQGLIEVPYLINADTSEIDQEILLKLSKYL